MKRKPKGSRSIGVRDLRAQLADTLNAVVVDRKPIYVTHHGRPIAVIQPITSEDVSVEL